MVHIIIYNLLRAFDYTGIGNVPKRNAVDIPDMVKHPDCTCQCRKSKALFIVIYRTWKSVDFDPFVFCRIYARYISGAEGTM